jgi:hypothetical protein
MVLPNLMGQTNFVFELLSENRAVEVELVTVCLRKMNS